MSRENFSLQPFPSSGALPDVKITGNISRHSNTLAIRYALLGALSEIVIPAKEDIPARINALWEETCFELFIRVRGSDQYREVNLSPAGHWNVYSFTSYREEMKEETAFASLPFIVQRGPDSLQIELELDLGVIIPSDKSVEIAISAVVKLTDGRVTYWALTHPGAEPDFHRRDGFVIQM